MDNYHYIIAGLPELVPDFQKQTFSYSTFSQGIREQLSAKDRRTVDWFEFGSNEDNLSQHFYREADKSKNLFISKYFHFDKQIRNTQAQFLAKNASKDEDSYIMGDFNTEFDEYSKITSVLANVNMIDREQKMDELRWDKISEIVTFEYFSINVILSFLAKAKIVQRWSEMDKIRGAELFEQFVQEVRGTFKGIEL